MLLCLGSLQQSIGCNRWQLVASGQPLLMLQYSISLRGKARFICPETDNVACNNRWAPSRPMERWRSASSLHEPWSVLARRELSLLLCALFPCLLVSARPTLPSLCGVQSSLILPSTVFSCHTPVWHSCPASLDCMTLAMAAVCSNRLCMTCAALLAAFAVSKSMNRSTPRFGCQAQPWSGHAERQHIFLAAGWQDTGE